MTKRFDEMADVICDLLNSDDLAFYDGESLRAGDEETAIQIADIFRIAGIAVRIVQYPDYLENEHGGICVNHEPHLYYIEPVEGE